MFDMLKMDFEYGVYTPADIHQYVDMGFINEDQYDQITGQPVPNSAGTMAQSSAPQSNVAPSASSNAPVSSSSAEPSSAPSDQSKASQSSTNPAFSTAPQPSSQSSQSSNVVK